MQRFISTFLFLIAFFLPEIQANPVKQENSTAELISDVKSIQPGKSFWVCLKLSLTPGWHTYWINPGDTGLATSIDWILPEGFKASPIHWIPPQRLNVGKDVSFGYHNESFHLVEITPIKEISAQPQTITAKANWLVCGDMCGPEAADLSLTLPVRSEEGAAEYSDHQALIQQLKEELSKPFLGKADFEETHGTVKLFIPLKDLNITEIDSVSFFPFENDIIQNSGSSEFAVQEDKLVITLQKASKETLSKVTGVVQINDKTTHKINNFDVSFTPKSFEVTGTYGEDYNIFLVLLFALLGGIILNAMPCVFPILSLKALAIAQKKKSEYQEVRKQGFIYTTGVIFSFLALAFTLITLQLAGHSIGWGFQMQSPYFITFMIYLMTLIGLSLSGVFYLPIFFSRATSRGLSEQKTNDSFLIGILAVLVATPCSAPFMGIAIGYALAQPPLIILIVFIMLGLGFAIPYLCVCLFPFVLKLLPKPGVWMETLKEFLAFPMYATVLWLFWVLVQQTGTRGLITVGSGMVIMAFCLWLWRKLALENRFLRPIVFILFGILSLAPSAYLKEPSTSTVSIEPFSTGLLNKYREEKVPVLVNATAAWCITCKMNELSLKGKKVETLLRENNVHYLEADWTNQNKEITDYLKQFGRSGVPLYVYYPVDKDPIVLPQILTEEGLKKVITRSKP